MCERLSRSTIMVVVAAATAVVSMSIDRISTQGQAASAVALKTSWGEPDLQGIWTDEFDTPFQRPAKYANQEFFTDAQREELDKQRLALLNRRATERELAGAYNLAVFTSVKHVGMRTSLIVDPPNGQIPPLTLVAQKAAVAEREFRLVLCKQPKRARINCRPATEASTMRRPLRDSQSFLLATAPRASIALTVQRTEGW